jgi:hypothetical protein
VELIAAALEVNPKAAYGMMHCMAMHNLEWQLLEETYSPGNTYPQGYTYRAKVPGGWLVAVWAGDDKKHGLGGGLTFVPKPTHSWDIAGKSL